MEKKYLRGESINGVNMIVLLLFLLIFSLCVPEMKVKAASIGTVTANVLNLRKSPSTSSAIIGKLSKGTKVSISSQVKDRTGSTWYKVNAPVNGKTVTGYVALAYIKVTTTTGNTGASTTPTTTTQTKYIKRYAQVSGTFVNIRKSYTTKSKSLGILSKSTTVQVIGEKKVGSVKWYRIYVKRNGKKIIGYMYSDLVSLYPVTAKTTKYQLGQANVKMNLYKTANNYDTKLAILTTYQQLLIRGSVKVYNTYWTKVNAYVNGKIISGYVPSSRVNYLTATVSTATSTKSGYTKIGTTARRLASVLSSSRGALAQGTQVTVLGTITVSGTQWYKCQYSVSGTTQTGYIIASHVTISVDPSFDASIEGFPSSYKPALKKLHQTYPNWKFVPVNTGLSWSTVIYNEKKFGVNTISSTVPYNGISGTYSAPFSYLSTGVGAYSWDTDAYTLCDGKIGSTTWYTASEDVVKYYMDPRNALNVTKIFQFESLAYNPSQTKSVVTAILKGTFMNGTYSYVADGKTYHKYYNDSFMEAGKIVGVSPYFLAARARQELGVSRSGSVTGSYPGYEGLYNYYNIGANDSPGGGAIANGLKYAGGGTSYDRPWDNPYKAIVGGAKYIASSYIQRRQNTLYFQKFNVVDSSRYYWGQYMTNVQAPTSESNTAYNAYNNYGILKDSMVFYIPIYNNMPASPCALPTKTGNPNSYLKSLIVKNDTQKLAFNQTFAYNTTSYNMVVPSGVNTITISASAVSKYAQGITGTGIQNISSLAAGQSKTFNITCTAGNGTTKTYTITVKRMAN